MSTPARAVEIRTFAFDDLPARIAYDVWRLRQQVFIIEQDSPYDDLDGRDHEPDTLHVVLTLGGEVAGCVRLLVESADVVRIGRVVLDPAARGQGLADRLMQAALTEVGDRESVLGGQAPLADWYASFGFVVDGPDYIEDGIPHVPMRRAR